MYQDKQCIDDTEKNAEIYQMKKTGSVTSMPITAHLIA